MMSHNIVDLSASSPPSVAEQQSFIALSTAIDTARLDRLRVTLRAICNSSVDASNIARDILLVPTETVQCARQRKRLREECANETETEDEDGDDEDDDDDDPDSDQSPQEDRELGAVTSGKSEPKTMRSRYATCEHCSEEYDVTENKAKACIWHDGKPLYRKRNNPIHLSHI